MNRAVAGPIMERIAVLPLENADGDPEEDYHVEGADTELVLDMAKALCVTSRGSAAAVGAEGLRIRESPPSSMWMGS